MNALIFVTHVLQDYVVARYERISDGFKKSGTPFFLIEDSAGIFLRDDICNTERYNKDNILNQGYQPIEPDITPGSNHFITLDFFHRHPDFDNYWVVEYDVDYLGDWELFFKRAGSLEADFLSCHLCSFADNPHWYWWDRYEAVKPCYKVDIYNRLRSFNPIYRISNDALKCLDTALRHGLKGHHETVIPTLLSHMGYTLKDLGGRGLFVEKGFEDFNYLTADPRTPLGSMSHLPFERPFPEDWRNILVHPVKHGL